MTMWKAGMLAEMVREGLIICEAGCRHTGKLAPPVGSIHRVTGVAPAMSKDGLRPMRCGCIDLTLESGSGALACRFRPLVNDDDDAELIARIKRCKPAKAPVITDNRHERSGYREAR